MICHIWIRRSIILLLLFDWPFGNTSACDSNCKSLVQESEENDIFCDMIKSYTKPSQAFSVQYWKYISFKNAHEGYMEFCTVFKAKKVLPNERLYYSCNEVASGILYVASHPQRRPEQDYLHRIIVEYPQYDTTRERWQPSLVMIHNDSCSHSVDVMWYLAPPELAIRTYVVALRRVNSSPLKPDEDNAEVIVKRNDVTASVNFRNVSDGVYHILISACSNCVSSNTSAFIIQGNHSKCGPSPMPQSISTTPESLEKPSTDVLLITAVTAITTGFVLCAVVICVRVQGHNTLIKCVDTPHRKGQEQDNKTIMGELFGGYVPVNGHFIDSVSQAPHTSVLFNNDFNTGVTKTINKENTEVLQQEESPRNVDDKAHVSIEPVPPREHISGHVTLSSWDPRMETMNTLQPKEKSWNVSYKTQVLIEPEPPRDEISGHVTLSSCDPKMMSEWEDHDKSYKAKQYSC